MPMRPASRKRKAREVTLGDQDVTRLSSSVERPSTTSTAATTSQTKQSGAAHTFSPAATLSPLPHHRPLTSGAENNSNMRRRWSIARHSDLSSPPEADENRRDSGSSRGSWMRRLSTLPISVHSSPRSSIGPDSPSINGSDTQMFRDTTLSPTPLPPNKLVKRVPSAKLPQGASKSRFPTLRRPATSHQRSANLQQQYREHSSDPISPSSPIFQVSHQETSRSTPVSKFNSPVQHHAWRPFFESRPTKTQRERPYRRSTDGGAHDFHSLTKSVMSEDKSQPTPLQPGGISTSNGSYTAYFNEENIPPHDGTENTIDSPVGDVILQSKETPVEKRPRRSLSMNFRSPFSWVLRSGSIRGNKRAAELKKGERRYSSAPAPVREIATAYGSTQSEQRVAANSRLFPRQQSEERVAHMEPHLPSGNQQRSRNASSPLPPLSRLSSFNIDLARHTLSSSSSSAPRRSPNSPILQTQTTSTSVSTPGDNIPISPLYFTSHSMKKSRTSDATDRGSTLVGSDSDIRGFASGEDDDLDFQSETVFDSFRSGATGSMRSNNTQLDAMFDESPPTSGITTKSKRLSVHELLNGIRDGTERIVEEDEGMSTPVKDARSRSSQEANQRTPVRQRNSENDDFLKSSPPNFSLAHKDLATKDFGRLSLDDEEDDEDWTRDDENPEIQSLSLPSSSLNSRKVSPSFRAALADLTHSSSTNEIVLPSIERPKSNLFDWSEPTAEMMDYMGKSPRPKTAHVKQNADGRGGRTIGRRGPNALHIRSQSVPVVPDVAGQREHTKSAHKFGTWGLGGKGVSEEWDADFEFETTEGNSGNGDADPNQSIMVVPLAIQESQDHVVGHVGQIREVCLLVEDLKRLRLLAREKGLLSGPYASLWKEAEGIIALAVPDDEDPTLSPTQSPISPSFEPGNLEKSRTDGRYTESEAVGEDTGETEVSLEVANGQRKGSGTDNDVKSVRRRSVFSPEDDIFGAGLLVHSPVRDQLRLPPTSPRQPSIKASSEYARSVMETMHQHRATSDPQSLSDLVDQASNKMPFDTTSLRDLVNRASALSRTLGDLIRKADGSPSPRESSPAFIRVFTPTAEAMVNPSKHLPRNHSDNSARSGSIESSPTRTLGQRMHMMTVV